MQVHPRPRSRHLSTTFILCGRHSTFFLVLFLSSIFSSRYSLFHSSHFASSFLFGRSKVSTKLKVGVLLALEGQNKEEQMFCNGLSLICLSLSLSHRMLISAHRLTATSKQSNRDVRLSQLSQVSGKEGCTARMGQVRGWSGHKRQLDGDTQRV